MASITTESRNELIALYVAMFNAAPGADNLSAMVALRESGKSLQDIATTYAAKTDFATTFPGLMTADEFAAKLAGILLGSEASDGANTWAKAWVVAQLNAGLSPASIITKAVQALRTATSNDFLNAKAALANKVDVASYYSVTDLQSSTSLTTLQGVIAGVTSAASTVTAAKTTIDAAAVSTSSQTFTLTTGADTKTANTFYGVLEATPPVTPAGSLQSYDTLTGAGKTGNSLILTDSTAVAGALDDVLPVGLTLNNIQNITLTTANNAGGNANAFDTTAAIGLTSVNIQSSGANKDQVTAALTTDVTVKSYADSDLIIKGGKNINLTQKGAAGTVKVGGTVATNNAGTVTISNTGTGGGTTTVDGGTTVNITTGALTTGTVSVGPTIAASGTVSVTNAGTSATLIAGGTAATVNDTTGATSGAGNVGAVGVSLVSGTTNVTQSAVTAGDVIVTGGTGASVTTTGGGAAGAVTLGTTGSTTLIAGNATITDTFAGPNTDALAVAATGTVTINTTRTSGTIAVGTGTAADDSAYPVTINNATTVGASTYYGSGVTTVATNGSSAVSLKGGSIAGGIAEDSGATALKTVTLDGTTGTGTITARSALSTLNITNNAATTPNKLAAATGPVVTVTNTTADNTLALNISNAAKGVTVTDSTAAAINVSATGTSLLNKLTLIDASVPVSGLGQTISISNTGTGVFQLGGFTNGASSATALTVSGTGKVDLGDLASAPASAGTSAPASIVSTNSNVVEVKIDGTRTSFSGGTGTNSVWLKDTATITKSISGGSGTNNTVILSGVQTHYAAGLGSGITGFQNLQLNDGSSTAVGATGTYTAVFPGTLINNANLAPVVFDQTAKNQPITLLPGSGTANSTTYAGNAKTVFTVATGSAAGDTTTITINGVSLSTGDLGVKSLLVVAQSIAAMINAAATPGTATANAALAGVSASYTTSGVVTISGLFSAGNISTTNAGVGTVTYTDIAGTTAAASGSTVANALNTPSTTTDTIISTSANSTTNNLPVTLNQTGASAGPSVALNTAYQQTISVNSIKSGVASSIFDANTLTINDTSNTTVNSATAYPTNKIVVTGTGSTTLNYMLTGSATNGLATIDGSAAAGSLNVSKVQGASTGITITGGAGSLTAFGSGYLAGQSPSAFNGANDVITTGAGGGSITIGYGGAGGAAGSETINLTASTAKADTITTGLNLTANGGQRATISGFTSTTSTLTNDKIVFQGAAIYSADNVAMAATSSAAATTVHVTAGTGIATNPIPVVLVATNLVAGSTTSFGGTDRYTVSNGVITFTGTDTLAQKTLNARGIVDAAGAYHVAAFGYGSDTYVVQSGQSATTANDTILALTGLTGITQLGGTTPALGNLVSTDVGSSTATAGGAGNGALASTGNTLRVAGGNFATIDNGGTAVTQDDTGYAQQIVTGAQTSAPLHTFNNLAPSATVYSDATSNWSLTTTQLGTAGSGSMTFNMSGAGMVVDVATFTGDASLTIASTVDSAGQGIITSIVDPNNTLTAITIANPLAASHLTGTTFGYDGRVSVVGITDTALATISISSTSDVLLGTSAAPLSQAALAVSTSATAVGVQNIYLSGAGAKITATSPTAVTLVTGSAGAVGDLVYSALGANSTVLGGTKAATISVGANGTVTMLQGSLTGAGNAAANVIAVGTNSTITLGTGQPTTTTFIAGDKAQTVSSLATDGGSTIKTYTAAGSDVTGAGSSGAYTMVTVNNAKSGVLFDLWSGGATEVAYTAGGGTGGGLVNVGSATSLASALDMAATTLSAIGAREVGYFQYGGDTYVLGVGVAGETALGATDVLVKMVGLIDAGAFTVASSVLTF